jgi:S-(hydroxymethyl)glutathione dehydrogenase/alcohol dehydrogenase
VLVEMVATGLCHSDDHFVTRDVPAGHLPLCGGHEGAGIVAEVGPGVTDLAVGDHVLTSFIPACGRCRWCAAGRQELCDNGASILLGDQLDGTYRMHARGADVSTMAGLGTFAEWQVYHELSCVKIDPTVPLGTVCLVSCGVPTGWGSATNAVDISVGDVVVVMGCGGIGINAVQGAAHKGAAHVVAVDPQPFKLEMALKLGATEAFSHISEATEYVRSITNGQGANVAIVTVGIVSGEIIGEAFTAVAKGGTVAVTAVGDAMKRGIDVNLTELSMYEKRIQGVLYGLSSPRVQIPALIGLYRNGILKLDELITRRYRLDDINQAYEDMHAGLNIRGVIEFQ